ncbi:hypothetical protein F2Q69_00055364 [Brassica cretica]|uniref:Uncharacterized protein n=1 Tax=Brassica cretica TaxID=69181 RepID=A0A8S9MVM6_BRACR|nr:hypothetical protein F2Q69_00055364 [Brassica cretica]
MRGKKKQTERKSVERLVAVIDTDSSREFSIEKGQGPCLKDIPSVAYKVTRKMSDENLKLLHTILFARRGKAAQIKTNILGFSGFVWHGNEEKAEEKIKEKLDKCNKEKLWEFCDLFDIHITKATTKKEVDSVISDIPRDGPRRPAKNAIRDWTAIFRTASRAG